MKSRKAPPKQQRTRGPHKMTSPAAIMRALELTKAGKSLREVSSALKAERLADVAPMTISRLLSRSTRTKAKQRAQHVEVTANGNDSSLASALDDIPTSAPLDVLRDRLAKVRGLLKRLEPSVESGTYSPTSWVTLMNAEMKLAATIASLTPPAPEEAAKDPHNIAAREMVHRHVLRAIEAVEARNGRLCPRCRVEVEAQHADDAPLGAPTQPIRATTESLRQ